MNEKLSAVVRYSTSNKYLQEVRYHKDALRRQFGADLYQYLHTQGLFNTFTIKIRERCYPVRILGNPVELSDVYGEGLASPPPEFITEEAFEISAIVTLAETVRVYTPKMEVWDYSLRKSSMPEWLKSVLRWIWKEND